MGFSRRFGTRGGRRGSVVARVGAPVAPEVPVFDLLPNYWYRADNVTLNAGTVATIPNKVGTDALVNQGATLPLPVQDPLFLDKPSILFSGTQYLDSNLSAASWAFMSDGTGFEAFHVFAPTNTSADTFIISATLSQGSPGSQQACYVGGSTDFLVKNSAAQSVVLFTSSAGVLSTNSPTYINGYYKSTSPVKAAFFVKEAVVGSAVAEGTPSATGNTTFCLGARSGDRAVPAKMRWCDTIIFNRALSEYERQVVRTYIQKRYGIAAPVVTPAEGTVLKLKPRNWIRAQESVDSAGFATAFNDKAMPGHQLVQGTPALQLFSPVPDPLFNNKPTLNFQGGGQMYDSTLPPSAWQFLHDGTGAELFFVATLTANSSVTVSLTTRVGGNGITIIHANTSTSPFLYLQSGPGSVQASSATGTGVWPLNTGTYISHSIKSSAPFPITQWNESSVGLAMQPAAPFVTGLDAEIALRLGYAASNAPRMKWAEVLIFNRALTEIERQTVREYIQDRYAILAPTINANDRPVLELQPRNWFRASNFTTAGANVASFYDKAQPGHVLAQATPANQVVAPLSDPLFTNKLSANFTGAQMYDSNATASAWKFLHDGTGMEVFHVLAGTSATLGVVIATLAPSSPGMQHYLVGDGAYTFQVNGSIAIADLRAANTAAPVGVATYIDSYLRSSQFPPAAVAFDHHAVSASHMTLAGAPVTGDPAGPLRLGNQAGASPAFPANMKWCETLIFNRVLTEYERQTVREYIQAQYGIAAPVISSPDRAILKLNPRNWLRADSATVVAGKVTALLDKAMPGATVAQATTASQASLTTDPAQGNQPVLVFDGVDDFYDSNLPSSAWTFLHNGLGMYCAHKYKLNGISGVQLLQRTTANANVAGHALLAVASGFTSVQVFAAAGTVIIPTGSASSTLPMVLASSFSLADTPDARLIENGVTVATSNVSVAPGTGAPQFTLRLGAGGNSSPASNFLNAAWYEAILFDRVLNAAEEKILSQYYTDRYAPPAVDKPIFDLQPFSWFRADTYNTTGAVVTAFRDRAMPGHLLSAGGTQVLNPVADPLFAGKPTADFNSTPSTNFYDSSLPPSAWKFIHDGTGCEIFTVATVATTGSNQVVWCTRTGGSAAGCSLVRGPNTQVQTIFMLNDSGAIVAATGGTVPWSSTAGTYQSYAFKSSAPIPITLWVEGTADIAVQVASAPGSGNPQSTFRLGNDSGQRATMKWAEVLIFNRTLTELERQQVREYIQARYGIVAPTISSEDRQILSLSPFSWSRADTYTTAGANVAGFTDKALPGHALVQATPASQVAISTVDALYNNKPSAKFIGAQWYQSNVSASAWKFLHDGTGCEEFTVYSSPLLGTEIVWATGDIGQRAQRFYSALGVVSAYAAGYSASGVTSAPGTQTPNTAYYAGYALKEGTSPELVAYSKGNSYGSIDGTPSLVAPEGPFTLGANSAGLYNSTMNWVDTILFKRVLTAAERLQVRQYIQNRYGVAP